MENISLEQFNPTVAELTAIAEGYKGLTITGIDDKEGIAKVHAARMDLRSKRVAITKLGKELREDAQGFVKKVIAKEKELIGIIEPTEGSLQKMEDAISQQIERQKRIALIPDRNEKLKAIGVEATTDELMDMDPDQFAASGAHKLVHMEGQVMLYALVETLNT